ncbi:hypothetical protein TorRG33x02_043770, partial [Trema orientale]
MKAFIKALDEKAWRSVLSGWSPPTIKDDEGKDIIKPELSWSSDDDKLANYNSKALHAILNGVDTTKIKMITNCESAKEAWDILQTHFEGSGDMKRTKLIMLTSKFEELRMKEDETLSEYFTKLYDISNEAFALGKRFSDTKMVRKIFRSLPDRFNPKLTAIEESKNLDTMKVEELMGSLQTYEMNLRQREKASKSASKYAKEDDVNLALLTKNMGKMSKSGNSNKGMNFLKPDSSKKNGIQCRECEGYGHVQAECANTLKKKAKAMTSIWSDEEFEGSQEEDDNHVSNHIAFGVSLVSDDVCSLQKSAGHVATQSMQRSSVATSGTQKDHDTDSDSDESELNEESIRASYENIYSQWIRVVDQNRSLEGRISALIQYKENSEIKVQKLETLLTEKEAKLKEVSVELERTQKSLKMLNSGTDKLNHILSVGKSSSDHKGLRFEGEHSNSKTVFVKSSVSNSFAGTGADVVTQKLYVTTHNKIASPSQVTGNRADVATYLKSAASGST